MARQKPVEGEYCDFCCTLIGYSELIRPSPITTPLLSLDFYHACFRCSALVGAHAFRTLELISALRRGTGLPTYKAPYDY